MKLVAKSHIEFIKEGEEFFIIYQDHMYLFIQIISSGVKGFISTSNVDKIDIVPEEHTALILVDEAC